MATKEKNIWILLIFILSGLVVGGLLGELASRVSWLWWLRSCFANGGKYQSVSFRYRGLF